MDICLGYFSSLQYWRHHPADQGHRDIVPGQTSYTPVPDKRDLAAFDSAVLGLKPPLHLRVDATYRRPAPAGSVLHACSKQVPEGSFARVAANVTVSTPELCFLQLANKTLTLPHLVLLGMELCGGYVLRPDVQKGYVRCKPLTSVERLTRYVGSAANHPGVRLARRALDYVANGSLSPAESLLSPPLALPTTSGGYNIDVPEFNKRIDLPRSAQREAGRTHFKCDLYWPEQNVGIEYNGKWHYDAQEQRDNDVVRENILADLGVDIMVVTAAQLYDAQLFDVVARRLVRRLGKRLRIRTADFEAKRLQLHAELTGSNPTL